MLIEMDVRQTELSEEIAEHLGRVHVKMDIGQEPAWSSWDQLTEINTESFDYIKNIRCLEIGH